MGGFSQKNEIPAKVASENADVSDLNTAHNAFTIIVSSERVTVTIDIINIRPSDITRIF